MKCPHCGSDQVKVVWSRSSKGYPWQVRRRECSTCHCRFTTDERPRKEAPIGDRVIT